jgi:polyribonucleotide nucleotidyltransferase
VVVRLGDTMTLVATVSGPGRVGLDFFPLTVDYREKVYAAGKFPGGFIKREGRPTTKEILTSRLIDRPIRPLFPDYFRDEVQIQAGPISADRVNDADVLSMLGASATLMLARLPFLGPVGAIRVGRVNGELIVLPTAQELKNSDFDLIVASTEKTIVMIEGFAQEVPEPEMHEAIMAAHRLNQEMIALQHELISACGLPPFEKVEVVADSLRETLYDRLAREIREAKGAGLKQERKAAVQAIQDRIAAELVPATGGDPSMTLSRVKAAFSAVEERVVRELILDGRRPDGRGPA